MAYCRFLHGERMRHDNVLSIEEAFGDLTAPAAARSYELTEILTVVLCAATCGADS
jgi:hypothetical protein